MKPLSKAQFAKIQHIYWVPDTYEPQWKYWVVSKQPPTNTAMTWRRPTYEEALVRQMQFADNPVRFEQETQEVAAFASRLRMDMRKQPTHTFSYAQEA